MEDYFSWGGRELDVGRAGVEGLNSEWNKKRHGAWRPQNESARGSKSVRAKNERGSSYRPRVRVGVGEMNSTDSKLTPGWIGVKFFFENFLSYRILKFSLKKHENRLSCIKR
jgi:hypothetical protein